VNDPHSILRYLLIEANLIIKADLTLLSATKKINNNSVKKRLVDKNAIQTRSRQIERMRGEAERFNDAATLQKD